MHIYLQNNPDRFHPNPIRNDKALGFFEFVTQRRRTTKQEEEEEAAEETKKRQEIL